MATINRPLDPSVCPCAAVVAGRVYPVARPAAAWDERFTAELVREVGDALAGQGYPAIEEDSPDWYALMWCLWRYVYGHAGSPPEPGPGAGEGSGGAAGSGPLG
ncbi:hypothetical protein ACQP1W_38805 [Spirillospora sp. CA-255316]